MERVTGFEPVHLWVEARSLSKLGYTRVKKMVAWAGFEPAVFSL
jgi:hypothetical protein